MDQLVCPSLHQKPGTSSKLIIHAMAFVDWNSQLLLTKCDYKQNPVTAAKIAFNNTAKKIGKSLIKLEPDKKFIVTLRLYHGWRHGYEETKNAKAIKKVISEADFSCLSLNGKVSFSANVGFGDLLVLAQDKRRYEKLNIHLPNTLRKRSARKYEEKMVDTALATDMLITAWREPEDWIIVVSEDDDIVPALFSSEAIIQSSNSRALLLTERSLGNNMLKLNGINVI